MPFVDTTEAELRRQAARDAEVNSGLQNVIGGIQTYQKQQRDDEALRRQQALQDENLRLKRLSAATSYVEKGGDPAIAEKIARGEAFFDAASGEVGEGPQEALDQAQPPAQATPQTPLNISGMTNKLFGGVQAKREQKLADQENKRQLTQLQLNKARREEEEAGKSFTESREGQAFIQKKLKEAEIEATKTKRLSPSDVQKVQEGAQIPKTLQDVKAVIQQNADIFGPIEGRARSFNPYDERAQAVDAQMRIASQQFGRYMEGGVLRKEDEEKYRKMFPQLSDTPESAANKLAIVQRLLSNTYNSQVSALQRSGFDVRGLPQSVGESGLPSAIAGQPRQPEIGGVLAQPQAMPEQHPQANEAINWAQQNPNDPRAQEIMRRFGQ